MHRSFGFRSFCLQVRLEKTLSEVLEWPTSCRTWGMSGRVQSSHSISTSALGLPHPVDLPRKSLVATKGCRPYCPAVVGDGKAQVEQVHTNLVRPASCREAADLWHALQLSITEPLATDSSSVAMPTNSNSVAAS